MDKLKILAIIPARGGSKGIPNKNIIDVGGKPLIVWSIEAALKSKYISKVIVSSDSDIILNIAKKTGSEIIKRPNELASDSARSEPVVKHVVNELLEKGEKFDYVILLQPTSPLRTSEDIDRSFEKLVKTKATAIISVSEVEKNPLKSFMINETGFLKGIVNDEFPFMPRQELPKVFYPNGSIYIIETRSFLKTNKLFTDKTIAYETSLESSIDIDCISDVIEINKKINK